MFQAKALARCAPCPNIVRYFGCWTEADVFYLQMELAGTSGFHSPGWEGVQRSPFGAVLTTGGGVQAHALNFHWEMGGRIESGKGYLLGAAMEGLKAPLPPEAPPTCARATPHVNVEP